MRSAYPRHHHRPHDYYVYILTNRSYTVLYTGMTNDLATRIRQHKNGIVDGFTKRYRTHLLVYCEWADDVWGAIQREKQIKGWSREKKIDLIEAMNPSWHDLSEVQSFPVWRVEAFG